MDTVKLTPMVSIANRCISTADSLMSSETAPDAATSETVKNLVVAATSIAELIAKLTRRATELDEVVDAARRTALQGESGWATSFSKRENQRLVPVITPADKERFLPHQDRESAQEESRKRVEHLSDPISDL